MSNNNLINAGTVKVQAQYRVNIKGTCKKNKIELGDDVEVFVKKVG